VEELIEEDEENDRIDFGELGTRLVKEVAVDVLFLLLVLNWLTSMRIALA